MSTNKNSIIIGIGGCAALDVARACATPEVPAILIPTILSTVCISVDKSVFVCEGGTKTFQTESPHKIILSLKVLLNTKKDDLIKWSQSGFGDLFAKTGASIDVVFRKTKRTNDKLSLEKVRRHIPEVFEAMDWVLNHFKEYDKKDLEALAVFLHEASVAIIILGGFELSGGAEHDLAYAMNKRHMQSANKWPTHGQLVSIGTLIELNLFGKITGDYSLYERMVKIYKKVGLPIDYKYLENLGIKKEFIIQGIKDIAHLNTFMSYYSKKAISLLDKIFKRSGSSNE